MVARGHLQMLYNQSLYPMVKNHQLSLSLVHMSELISIVKNMVYEMYMKGTLLQPGLYFSFILLCKKSFEKINVFQMMQ